MCFRVLLVVTLSIVVANARPQGIEYELSDLVGSQESRQLQENSVFSQENTAIRAENYGGAFHLADSGFLQSKPTDWMMKTREY